MPKLGTLVGLNFAFERIYFAAPRSSNANLRVCLPQMRATLRCFSIDAGRTVSGMSQASLPAGKMGPRQGETAAGQGRRNYL
jgi:hypothetical protein